jgi:hypothetical protein
MAAPIIAAGARYHALRGNRGPPYKERPAGVQRAEFLEAVEKRSKTAQPPT